MTEFDGDITGALWDLDNTLYPLDKKVEHAFNVAIAHAVLDMGVPMQLEQAVDMAYKSYAEHGFSGHHFIHQYGINHLDLHHTFHEFLDEKVIQKNENTRELFASNTRDHALITHGSRVWATRVLGHLELQQWFPEPRVFAYENYAFESKARSRKPFEMALASINKNPKNVVMVEDTLENLRVPHEMGMTTIYLKHGRTAGALPSFVDHAVETAQDVLNALKNT